MSSSHAEAKHVPDNGQTDPAQAWSLLLVPALVTAILSRVIDGKGLLLASYWAVRYFAPAALSLWAAKHARKQWDFLSGMMVMAATYAVSMAASYRIWTGPTSTVKMQYPLFHGKVTIPAVVGQWIRHNIGLAKILTKMLAWGPWVFLTLAAALQIAVWVDETAQCKAQQRGAVKSGSQHSSPEGVSGLSPSAAGVQATALSAAPPAASSVPFVAPVPQSNDGDKAEEEESVSGAKDEDEDEQGDYEETDARLAYGSSQLKIWQSSSDGSDKADEARTNSMNWLMPHGADQARLKGQLANAEDSQVSKLLDITHRHDQGGQLEGNFETQLEAVEQRVQQRLEGQLTDQLAKLQLKGDTDEGMEAALDLKVLASKLSLARLNIVIDGHKQQMTQLKQRHEESIASIESDKAEQLEELQDEHEEDVASINSEHEEELELVRAQHEEELEQLGEEHAEEFEQLREEHEDDQRKSVDDHEKQLAELREEHELHISSLKQQMAALPMSTEKHQQELQDLESEHAQQVKELHSKLETVTAQQQGGADKLAMLNDEITSLQEQQERLQRNLSQAQRNVVHLRSVVAQNAEQQSSEVNSLHEQLEEALEEEDRLRAEEQLLRKHVEVSTADHGDQVLALQDKFSTIRTELVIEALQVTDDLRQQLASANLKAEQVQGELISQQRSSETSVEALAIEHKCTKDKLQAEVDWLTAQLSDTAAEAAHTKLLYNLCQQRLDAAETHLQQTQHDLSQAQEDVEEMRQHFATAMDGKVASETRAGEIAQTVKWLENDIQDLKAESKAVAVQHDLAQAQTHDKLKALTDENSLLKNRVKETLQSHMVMAEEYEALQEEQKAMYHQMEELLALQEGNISPDKVPAPAVVQKEVEDATSAHSSQPAAATLTWNDEEDGMAAADVTSHDGSFEVEVQVESFGDEEHSASGAVQVNVQSAKDMPGKVQIHIEGGDEDTDDLAGGAVKINIHPAGVNDKPKQEGMTSMNIAEASSDGDEFRKGESDNDEDDGDGMIPVNVHTSLLG